MNITSRHVTVQIQIQYTNESSWHCWQFETNSNIRVQLLSHDTYDRLFSISTNTSRITTN